MTPEKRNLLIDENSLGVDRYLVTLNVNIIKVGDPDAPPLKSPDDIVAKYALDHNCTVITRDDKLVKQCQVLDVPVIAVDITDLAKKVIKELSNKL